jgi:hypothetical protein
MWPAQLEIACIGAQWIIRHAILGKGRSQIGEEEA